MGNSLISPCFLPNSTKNSTTKLIFWGGATHLLSGRHLAAKLLSHFPNCSIFHADSFFIGHPIPTLSFSDELLLGETYFILPADLLPFNTLTANSLALLNGGKRWPPPPMAKFPFECVKGEDGRKAVKVVPEFIMEMITVDDRGGEVQVSEEICSTPELKRHYEQLVVGNRLSWSPKLETVSERKVNFVEGYCYSSQSKILKKLSDFSSI
ncbi:hypothetical protein IEQ34_016763 [Dendrobium chrysotoxum]|uniref:Uncharacterized protein n=1 Tax=Dendrobium chrysotoxum TaxID=161865 RepID=A0AAV7GG21_DENCH|nr:hypothetical protein IEQ34_016763 [Dendrobium chrysotoxum]